VSAVPKAADLDGRVIAIAGAAGGLGPVVCERLAAVGVTLACTDVAADRLGELESRLGIGEQRFDAEVVDLLDGAAARQWAARLAERFGGVDGLLHLVGGWRGGEPLASFDLADYEWLHDLLVRTGIHSTRAFFDHLAGSEHGRFVLVSSSQAQHPSGTNAAYAAAKAAAESWTLALADSFANGRAAATANIVVVNAILTPQMRAANPEKRYETFTAAEDIADAIAFLCSDAAAKMNGKRLPLYP
jgi:NAD(P)-dependent dehydrogenase (short-subunit alcohol dehydrogenase family)